MNDSKTNYYKIGIEVLRIEADSIQLVAERIDTKAFNKACELIINCKGKLVVAGVGKSGIIAHKIAATFASTGTMAINLSVADALHGDLGMVSSDDVMLLLSNSGETPELLALLPHLQRRNLPIIAIAGKSNSTLALSAYAFLEAYIEKEACPLNLAPTTSTTVALALGDALAVAIMKAKSIKEEDFAINHPAGKLGQRLSLLVNDIMIKPFPKAQKDDTIADIIQKISEGNTGAIIITEHNNQLLGIITDGDIRRLLGKKDAKDFHTLKAFEIMTIAPITVKNKAYAYEALQIMEKRSSQISVLPVVNHENELEVLGIVRIHDILGRF